MIRNALYILSLLLLSASSHGKDTVLVGYQALNRIYETKKELLFGYRPMGVPKIIQAEYPISFYSSTPVKSKNRLFIRINGTGRVYEAVEKSGDSLTIKRIDSTIFFGYNGGAYEFIYNDTIFSLGGNGYWRVNGQFRFYSDKNHEWDIIPVNTEIPMNNDCVHYHVASGRLFYIQVPFDDLVTGKHIPANQVYSFNVPKRENTYLGELHPELKKLFPYRDDFFTVPVPSLNMTFVAGGGGKIYLLDFIKNEVYRLSNAAIEKTFYGNSTGVREEIIFEDNGYIYFTRSNDPLHKLDSVPIRLADFKKAAFRIYTPTSVFGNSYYLIIPAIAGIIIIALVYNRRKNRVAEKIRIEQQFAMSDNHENTFKPVELELIQKIYAVSQLGKSYSVEDVNTALGLGRKSLEIQKKTRTDTLNRINHRFKMQFETQDDLIERVRSDEDRRYYRYFIREENMKKLMS